LLSTDQILQDLTEPQRQAVTHVDGPLLIIAGAGSGKTRVITRRVAHLLSLGIPATAVVSITFTNKAAGEMKSRVGAILGRPLRDFGRLDQPWPLICTFHSLGLRILRHYAGRIGLPDNFSVYDASDQQRLVKEAVRAAELDPAHFPPSTAHDIISDAKNRLVSAESFARNARGFADQRYALVYKHYEKLLKQNKALDFDDLLLRTAEAFRDHPDILAELQERFRYILIDEYQDTNHSQYIVAHGLALSHRNICVVGDPDQSIYAWRGADIRNILDFETDYPDATVIKLEQNYRSTQTILDIASTLIARNRQRKEKRLWTSNPKGEKAKLLLCFDERDEAQAVVDSFSALHAAGRPWGDMAIFYRVNALSRVMEDALRKAAVPYRIARGVDFYHRKEIKDVLAYLRVIANPDDELSLTRIVNVPARGISDKTVTAIQVHAATQGMSLWEAFAAIDRVPDVSARAARSVHEFVNLVRHWQALPAPVPASSPPAEESSAPGSICSLLEDVVATSGMEAYLKKIGGDERAELANVNELITAAAQFDEETPGTLADYLAQISLVSDIDTLVETGGAVTLLTLHAAKGLEYPVVAIIGMEEEILPHARVREHPEQLEEERRLCFVGITRTKELLLMSRARRRMHRGLDLPTAASQFLAEMPLEMIEVIEGPGGSSDGYEAPESHFGRFYRGQAVRHPKFGLGTIAQIGPSGRETRAIVDFPRAGRKTLILEYANLAPADED